MSNQGLAVLYICLTNGTELNFTIYEDTFYMDNDYGNLHFTMLTDDGLEAEAVFSIYKVAGYALSQQKHSL